LRCGNLFGHRCLDRDLTDSLFFLSLRPFYYPSFYSSLKHFPKQFRLFLILPLPTGFSLKPPSRYIVNTIPPLRRFVHRHALFPFFDGFFCRSFLRESTANIWLAPRAPPLFVVPSRLRPSFLRSILVPQRLPLHVLPPSPSRLCLLGGCFSCERVFLPEMIRESSSLR